VFVVLLLNKIGLTPLVEALPLRQPRKPLWLYLSSQTGRKPPNWQALGRAGFLVSQGLARLSLSGGGAVAEGRDFAFLRGDEDAVAIGYGALLDSAVDLCLTGY
jgi:hypothetical protein